MYLPYTVKLTSEHFILIGGQVLAKKSGVNIFIQAGTIITIIGIHNLKSVLNTVHWRF